VLFSIATFINTFAGLLGLCRVEGLQISKSTKNLNALLFFIAFLTSIKQNYRNDWIALLGQFSTAAAAQQHIDL